jgi:hypothetical protein
MASPSTTSKPKPAWEYVRRPWQKEAAKGMASRRWSIIVAHRRAGKTVEVLSRLVASALQDPREDAQYAYLAPKLKQARGIAWGPLKRMVRAIKDVKIHESDMWVQFAHGA